MGEHKFPSERFDLTPAADKISEAIATKLDRHGDGAAWVLRSEHRADGRCMIVLELPNVRPFRWGPLIASETTKVMRIYQLGLDCKCDNPACVRAKGSVRPAPPLLG